MKRRSGVERRRRRLADKIQQATNSYASQKAEFFTEMFQQDIDTINVNNGGTQEHNAAANQCGFFFEHEVFRFLSELAGGEGKDEYSAEQLRAAQYFSSGDQSIINYGRIITQAAKQVSEQIIKDIQKDSEKIEWEVHVIADLIGTTKSGKTYTYGNPAGDLQLIINGKSIILEIKWQENPNKMISYFHSVSEDTLFGGAFRGYLKKNFNLYWSHRFKEQQWKTAIGVNALSNFLLESYGNWKNAVQFLLSKGNAASRSGIVQDGKVVVHGTSASIEIADIENLTRAFEKKGLKMTNRNKKITSNTSQRGIKWMLNQEELANFGIRSFYGSGMKQTFSAKRASTIQKRAEESIDKSRFSYDMYINSKLFDQRWLATLQ